MRNFHNNKQSIINIIITYILLTYNEKVTHYEILSHKS